MILQNKTSCKDAEDFFCDEMQKYITDNLIIIMDYTKSRLMNGRCHYPIKKVAKPMGRSKGLYVDIKKGAFKIIANVKQSVLYPYLLKQAVGSKKENNINGFDYIWDSELLFNINDTMIWLLGHEVWHFLCKTKQKKGNYQTQANKFGFEFLRNYKKKFL